MTSIKLLFLLSCLSVMCFGQAKQQVQQLDSIFSMLSAQQQFNGTVLIAEKGKIFFEKGYGYSNEVNKEHNGIHTIFELASCSKQFTATAIILLKRQGKLDYKDKISKYLPELSFWDKVTIEDLLRHTSGLPEFLGDMAKDWDSTKIATNEDLLRFYAARKDSLQFEPKSKHRYCNTNYALLASIIERVSGKRYADFLAQNIFKPLKMNHTFIYNRREQPKKVRHDAIGYVWSRQSLKKIRSEEPGYGEYTVYSLDGIVGTAKVNSSVTDVYKWVRALKDNTLLTKAEFEEMTAITKTSNGKDIPYGFGLMVSKGENRFSFGHNGSWDGYATMIHHNMIKDRTIIILQNFKLGAFPYNNIVQILDKQTITTEFREKITLPAAEMEKYTGIYTDPENAGEAHAISYLDGHLFYNTTKVNWDMRFFPIKSNEFLGLRQGNYDSILRFTTLDNGDTKMEVVESGTIIGSGIKKKS
ncbi:serine hydrolase [Taibaiella sp. KBW10]|nr:serine hydrolase [Taibaiella sp. KBW10]